jgi:cell division septation protein DedD
MRRTLQDVVFAWKPTWTARIRARVQDAGSRFTADEILTILSAGEAGLKVEDVCAAADIPVEMYYRWKAKYRGLTPAKVRDRRRREQIVRRATAVSFAAAVVVTIGAPCAFLVTRWTTRSASAAPNVAASVPNVAPAVSPPASTPVPPTQPASQVDQSPERDIDQKPPVPVQNQPAPVAQEITGDEVDTSRLNGFSVQIAAVPDLQEARRAIAQLTGAGYPAFLLPTTVGQVSLYRVRVGPLKTRRLAEDVAERLQHEGYPTPWITK